MSFEKYDQKAKADAGKLMLTLVPTEIIKNIAAIRMYGNKKYGNSENWKTVDKDRYKNAAYRHWLAYLEDPHGVDEESGLPHLWHLACNVAFLCQLEKEQKDGCNQMKFGSSWKIHNSCFGCTERRIGCHGNCDKYKRYQDELSGFKSDIMKKKEKGDLVDGYITKSKIKNARSKLWER